MIKVGVSRGFVRTAHRSFRRASLPASSFSERRRRRVGLPDSERRRQSIGHWMLRMASPCDAHRTLRPNSTVPCIKGCWGLVEDSSYRICPEQRPHDSLPSAHHYTGPQPWAPRPARSTGASLGHAPTTRLTTHSRFSRLTAPPTRRLLRCGVHGAAFPPSDYWPTRLGAFSPHLSDGCEMRGKLCGLSWAWTFLLLRTPPDWISCRGRKCQWQCICGRSGEP